MKIEIKQPQGQIIVGKNGKAKLTWNPGFQQKWQGKIDNAQKFVDQECINKMKPYTPMITGMLHNSAITGTRIGSGKIHQIAPYARYLYYGEVFGPNIPIIRDGKIERFYSPPKKHPTGRELKYSKSVNRNAGKLWFERMKADHFKSILKGAQKHAERG